MRQLSFDCAHISLILHSQFGIWNLEFGIKIRHGNKGLSQRKKKEKRHRVLI